MAKIKDIVQLKSGYANFVDLKSAFEAAQENADRMAMYRPTKAHRKVLERICRALYLPNDKKFFLKSGSFGTGKSHLALMEANILGLSSGDPAIAGFYANYEKLDPEKARQLKNIRKDGQYLVAVCDYHSGKPFEDVVLKAIFEACRKKSLDVEVETEFDEADRQLADWEAKGDQGFRNFHQDFGKALEAGMPGMTVEQLRIGLRDYDSSALRAFQEVYREIMGGTPFHANSGNLIQIVKALIKRPKFKERFKGLAIFYDEFGNVLEQGKYSKDVLQGFMEDVCHQEPNVIFVGCIHKDFRAYADRLSRADAAVMSARITQVDLHNEGIEEIIGAIVETDKQGEVWKNEVQPKTGIFNNLLPVCVSLKLFPWIEDVNHIRQRILEDIYGLHPMALACLLHLSSEIGSDLRSAFTFFTGDLGGAAGSYAEFIKDQDIVLADGRLNLHTVDRLTTFFHAELSPKNTDLRDRQRQIVNGYQATLEAMRKAYQRELPGVMEDERLKILRAMLIFQLCQVPASLENIQFGLYCVTPPDKKQVKGLLQDMVQKRVLFFHQQAQTYELAASSGEDPYDLIQQYMDNPALHPEDMLDAFLKEAGRGTRDDYVLAKGYNMLYGEDKRFRVHVVRARDIGDALWDGIRKEHAELRLRPEKSSEGALVYALCEDEAEVHLARAAAGAIVDDNVALAVLHEPRPFAEALLKVKACRHYLPPSEARKISAETESRLRDLLENQDNGYLPHLIRLFTDIIDGHEACWLRKGGKTLVDRPPQSHKPADMLCEDLFPERCRIKHPDLNLCHDDRWRTGRNTALKQAVAVLLTAEQVMIDKGNPDNHGEKRYLEKVLLRGAGALRSIGCEGSVNHFVCESDPGLIHDVFPVLKELCRGLTLLGTDQVFPLGGYLETMRGSPYGAGGTPLMLVLAHVVRAYGERLTAYTDTTRNEEYPLRDYEDLAAVVSAPASKVVFLVRDVSPAQARMIDAVAKAAGASDLKHGQVRSLEAAMLALRTWWAGLPNVARIVTLYEPNRQERLQSLKDLLEQMNPKTDRFHFLLCALPRVYSLGLSGTISTEGEADALAAAFAEDVNLFNSGEQLAQARLAQALCPVFETQGDLIDCAKAMETWFQNLGHSQREVFACDDLEARQLLTRLHDQTKPVAGKLVADIPHDFGFGALADWTCLHVKDLAARLKQARTFIESRSEGPGKTSASPDVPLPIVPRETAELAEGEDFPVDLPQGADRLAYAPDGQDPRSSEKVLFTKGRLNLAPLLTGRTSLTVHVRAVDQAGNYSTPVAVRLRSKERKYAIQFVGDRNMLAEKKASFLWPDNREGLVAVLRSMIDHATKNRLLEPGEAERINTLLREMAAMRPEAGDIS